MVKDVKGEATVGVSIKLRNTSGGTTTDQDGKYSINVPSGGNGILVFSYTGYASKEINIKGKSIINVVLELANVSLNEVTM